MLKRAAMEAVAFSLRPTQLSELRDAFLAMDVDHSGYLSGDEFRRALRSSGASDKQVDRMFRELDQVRGASPLPASCPHALPSPVTPTPTLTH